MHFRELNATLVFANIKHRRVRFHFVCHLEIKGNDGGNLEDDRFFSQKSKTGFKSCHCSTKCTIFVPGRRSGVGFPGYWWWIDLHPEHEACSTLVWGSFFLKTYIFLHLLDMTQNFVDKGYFQRTVTLLNKPDIWKGRFLRWTGQSIFFPDLSVLWLAQQFEINFVESFLWSAKET